MIDNKKRLLYFFLLAATILLSIYFFSSATFADDKGISDDEIFYDYSPQKVNTLPIPDKIEFAGEVINLKRHDLRERFDRELMAFTYMHSTTFLLIKRANLYFPVIEPLLKSQNIPDDFKYLAVIESHLNPKSVSPAKAVGVWQFVPETAKEYGLEVDGEVDERYDLEKATVAACAYLRQSYEMYGSWMTAASSYNAGRKRISSSLEDQKAIDCFGLYLNEETSRYIFRLMAVKEVMSNPKQYGFHLQKDDFYHTVRTKEVEVDTAIESWADWAEKNGTDFVQLKYFNPWIRDLKLDNVTKRIYKVKIPYTEDLDFDIKKVKIHNKAWIN